MFNVFHDPRWSLGQETPGEDPLVVSTYGVFMSGVCKNKYIISDCDSIEIYYNAIHYTATPGDAAALALKVGINLNCGKFLGQYTVNTVTSKKVDVPVVDQSLIYNYIVLMRLGFFNAKGALPLSSKKIKNLAIVGPNANATEVMISNYHGIPCSYASTFQGLQNLESPALIVPPSCTQVAPLGHFVEHFARVKFGCSNGGFQRLQGSIDHSCSSVDPPLVGYPGQAGGDAIAQVIFGGYNPAGRTPFRWYPKEYAHPHAKLLVSHSTTQPVSDPASRGLFMEISRVQCQKLNFDLVVLETDKLRKFGWSTKLACVND
ncbi:hypothetical protein L3X38_043267 [Prunus dulcis]|uniref:Glycoside hydrolase family 3 C-terminal domain-containing protein n=1 Tax=Prunus dulcis TaxID=3755 RepID=A0AAD4YLZ4_PRUDU|nr:hypothetical protein L3X38_043267 [Prunus dulcis]